MAVRPPDPIDVDALFAQLPRLFTSRNERRAFLHYMGASTAVPGHLANNYGSDLWRELRAWVEEDTTGERAELVQRAAEGIQPQPGAVPDRSGEKVEVIGKAAQQVVEPEQEEQVEFVGRAAQKGEEPPLEVKGDLNLGDLSVDANVEVEDSLSTLIDQLQVGELSKLFEQVAMLGAANGRVGDSVLMLALLLARPSELIERSPEVQEVVLRDIVEQLKFPEPQMPLDEYVLALLDLPSAYQVSTLQIPKLRVEPPYLTDELVQVARQARVLAEGNDEDLETRHLWIALVAHYDQAAPQVQTYLQELGVDLQPIREVLLDALGGGDPWRQALGFAVYIPPSAGYISDSVDANAPDRLGIQQEVEAICRVLVARQVQPPLSLGLFGDWGSGKSFFMAKMRKEVEALATDARTLERRDGAPTAFCSRVVQIEFNAWHFADANLWASLVTHIYDELYRHLNETPQDEETLRADLEQQLKTAEGLVQAAEQELVDAEHAVRDAKAELARQQQERVDKEQALHNLLYDVRSLLKSDPKTQENIQQAADALGYPEAKESYEALRASSAELQTFGKRVAAVGQRVIREPFAWLALPLLGLVLLLPVVLDWVATQTGALDWWQNQVGEGYTLLLGIAGWIMAQIQRAAPYIKRIEDGFAKVDAERQRREDNQAQFERQELDAAREREQAAREHLRQTQTEYQRLQHELEEFSPSRRLARLVETRTRDRQYHEHLGIISLIRKDFQQLSELLRTSAETHYRRPADELQDDALRPPIQRIILYIDDLDRCRPERVVEVLEAVHLLMAFPLFVVVVGVDPRWLRRCLQRQYMDLLDADDDGVDETASGVPVRSSTPQDYLEKIFQIPFALRPIEEDGYKRLVSALLEPLMLDGHAEEAHHDGIDLPEGIEAETIEGQPEELVQPDDVEIAASGGDGQSATPDGEAQPEAAGALQIRTTSPVLKPEQLTFTSQEQRDIERLSMLFQTPRAVKRFINIYRLLRSSLPEGEIAYFEGTPEEPGCYRVALVLLAVVAGSPNLTSTFMHRLHQWMHEADGPNPWPHLLDKMAQPLAEDEASDGGPVTEAQATAWSSLARRLKAGSTDLVAFEPDELHTMLNDWMPRVARYSFSVQLGEG